MKELSNIRFAFLFFSLVSIMTIKAQSHWESIVLETDSFKYLVPSSAIADVWNLATFNDVGWKSGIGGFGFGDNDDNTIIPATTTLYLRKKIVIPSDFWIQKLLLDVDYDDGFVAYLNGTEIARSNNVPTGTPTFTTVLSGSHEALMYSGGLPTRFTLDPTLLKAGENTISFQFVNESLTSTDMTARIFIHAKTQYANILFHTTPDWFIPPLEVNFTESNLPIINIDTQGKTIVDDPKIDAKMGVIDNGKNNINYVSNEFNAYNGNIGIELRGETSLNYLKKNYRIETRDEFGENLNIPLLGLPTENDWILYGPYIDKSLIRNIAIFHIGEQTGRYVSRTVPCELILNGEYMGVYVLMEKIKVDENRVDIAKLKTIDNVGSELTGGYILRMDKTDVGTVSFSSGVQYLDRVLVKLQYYVPASDEITTQQKNYIKNYITEFETSLVSSNFSNTETGYHKYIDVGSFVDYMLTNEVALEVDRYRFSTYFFKEKDVDGNKLHAGPLWDADRGIGNDANWQYGQYGDVWQYNFGTVSNSRAYWWERLMQDSYFQNLFVTRWNYLRNSLLNDENIQNYIDSMAIILEQPQERNFQKWPIMGVALGQNTFVGKNYAEEIDYLSTWLRNRLYWIDANIQGEILHPHAQITLDAMKSTNEKFVVRYQLNDDYFNRTTFKNKNFKLNNESDFIQKDTIVYISASTVDVYLNKSNKDAVLPPNFTITALSKVINTGLDIESKTLGIESGIISTSALLKSKIYFKQNDLYLSCENPDLLGNSIEIYDSMGRLVKSANLAKDRINKIEFNMNNGIYLVKFYLNNQIIVRKVVK